MKCPSSFGTLRIASTYIGTVVGAGFASGQEILRFFSAYGWAGFWGIAISTVLFFFFGYSALVIGNKLKATSHLEVVRFSNGKVLGSFVDFVVIFFLFGALAVMIAGAGAIIHEEFGLSSLWGTLAMALLSFITVITGTKGVVNAISAVVPLLIVSVLIIFLFNINNSITESEMEYSGILSGATPDWLLSSFNYASYNLVTAVAVLAPLGAGAKSKKSLFLGSLLGSVGLGLCMAAINFCIITNITGVASLEVPTMFMAAKISPFIRIFFAAVLFGEVYSTAVGDLYGFVQRVSVKLPKNLFIALVTAGAFIAGQFGFSNLVRFLYPAVGYASLVFFAGVIYKWIRKPGFFTGKIKAPALSSAGTYEKKEKT